MWNNNALLVSTWLATGTAGVLMGRVAVAMAKRRMRASTPVSSMPVRAEDGVPA